MKIPVTLVRFNAFAVLLLALFPFTGWQPPFGPPFVLAQADWRTEYESVCSKTDIAMTLTADELKGLIARCDRLKSTIEAEEESTRKVYLRRLRMCRDLYQYVLESREKNP